MIALGLESMIYSGFSKVAVDAVANGTLVVLALVSLFTGFQIAFVPFRLCPFVFGVSAALIGLASVLWTPNQGAIMR